MELYAERGFEQTTVAEIAERAGLTERTFFRHYADKREVLFGGADQLNELLVNAVAYAPEAATPLEAVATGLEAVGALLQGRREFARRRQAIISANPQLQERELIKLASLAGAIAEVLRARGVAGALAGLTGELAMAVFKAAFEQWVEQADERELPQVIRESFEEMRALSTPRRQTAPARRRRAAAR
ncbi:MAG TPA: TetR family transcriptional regulator [Solirubrobacteraceae bacterium]|jgi:AcrR family transcriptional regulator|nr:TetR family transcriptional regulator [Solirubrobacteraceae bacterium]